MPDEPRVLYLDTETWSSVNLQKAGHYRYLHDGQASLLLITWAFADGPVHCTAPELDAPENATLEDFQNAVAEADVLCAHNVQFDRLVLDRLCRFDALSGKPWMCTLNRARIQGLPGSLGALSAMLFNKTKDPRGSRLVTTISNHPVHPDEWLNDEQRAILSHYAVLDTDLLRQVGANPWFSKLKIGELDAQMLEIGWQINASGVRVDEDTARKMANGLELFKPMSDHQIRELTNGQVQSVSQAERIGKYLARLDSSITDTRRGTLERLRTHRSKRVRELAYTVLQLRATSATKYQAMLDHAVDGLLKGEMVPHGAHTGRWTSHGVQMQNLPKRQVDVARVAPALALVHEKGLLAAAEELKTTPPLVARDCVRTCIQPKRDVFVTADFKQIEPRLLHWYAKDAPALAILADPAQDIYRTFGSTLFKLPKEDITGRRRMLAKQAVLGLGYAMGADKFVTTCLDDGLVVDYELLGMSRRQLGTLSPAQYVVNTYRKTNATVIKLWRQLEGKIDIAMKGTRSGNVIPMAPFSFRGNSGSSSVVAWKLPSGNVRYYRNVRRRKRPAKFDENGVEVEKARFEVAYSSARGIKDLYGGKLAENLCQATAGDLLNHCLVQLHKEMDIVLTVHDEIVVDCHEKDVDRVSRRLKEVMTDLPAWADGLPVAVEIDTHEYFG